MTNTSELADMYEVRDFKPEDKKFIMATFLRGLYYGDSWFSQIPSSIFMENYKQVVEALLFSPNTIVKVACLKEDPDVILGYSILGHNYSTIHWVFVKAAWRKAGVARSLTPSRPETITHLTALGRSLMNKFENVTFNPFKIS